MKPLFRNRSMSIFKWALTILVALVILVPLYWILISSLKPTTDLFASPIDWFPRTLTLDNYKRLFSETNLVQQIVNTLIIAGASLIITTAACLLGAYVFDRYRSKPFQIVFGAVLFSSLIPAIVTARPLYDYMNKLKLVNTFPGLILLYSSMLIPFTTLILKNFLGGIPMTIDEAAEIDGANTMQKLVYVIVPIMKPAIATVCIINFISCLNEFFTPLIFSSSIETLSTGIATLPRANSYDVPWELLSAMGCIILVPIILFVVAFEKKIMDGIMAGSVKE